MQTRIRMSAIVGAAIIGVGLTACSPVALTAVRVHDDGTVDFASCVEATDIDLIHAYTTKRTGPNGTIDDSTEVDLTGPAFDQLDVGQVITYTGMPDDWERLDIWLEGGDSEPSWILELDDAVLGEWVWNDGGLFAGTYPDHRCELRE